MLRTSVIGVGHLGRQHARIHANLAAEGLTEFVSVCDIDQQTAADIASERNVAWTTDWRDLVGKVDAREFGRADCFALRNCLRPPRIWNSCAGREADLSNARRG